MRNKILITTIIIFALTTLARAQYYYKDIVSNKLAQQEKSVIKEQKIRSIEVHSFEGDRSPSEGFFCEKKISKDYRRIETYTRAYTTGKSLLTSIYNDKGQLLQSTDSSDITVSTSTYQYNVDGNISSIVSNAHSGDDDFSTSLIEDHQYKYNGNKQVIQMLRIKNKKDSVLIDFISDAHGNVTDEIDASRNGQHYYYYYDTKDRLTDIVKFNVVFNKLKPDQTFEYNNSNQIIQMVSYEEGVNRNYYTWKYVYNDGVKIIEKCFSKENALLGYFEYEYK